MVTVVHDGIDTHALAPNPNVKLTLNGQLNLTKGNEVITFVNRNLEPYRGYHVFIRALPGILKYRLNALVLIVGGDDVSYGARPDNGGGWKDDRGQRHAAALRGDQARRDRTAGGLLRRGGAGE
jgi:glycosyltransferase involved in cell wall biosynthesis